MTKESLKNQIWTTRVSRVNAERRLIDKEKFIQGINIYYSCMTIIFSIMSVVKNDAGLSMLTTYISISLFISVLYLSSQKYTEIAKGYRENYTSLQLLEFKLNHIQDKSDKEIYEVEKQYCDLLNTSINHKSYDYYCTVHGSSGEYRKERWNTRIKFGFYGGKLWRMGIKLSLIILPLILYMFREVI